MELLEVACPECGALHRFGSEIEAVKCLCGSMLVGEESEPQVRNRYKEVVQSNSSELVSGSAEWGPEKWRQLHCEVRTAEQWEAWQRSIPCGVCRRSVMAFTSERPFEACPWWGFDFHNAVNQKLGRQLFLESEAVALYGWDARAAD